MFKMYFSASVDIFEFSAILGYPVKMSPRQSRSERKRKEKKPASRSGSSRSQSRSANKGVTGHSKSTSRSVSNARTSTISPVSPNHHHNNTSKSQKRMKSHRRKHSSRPTKIVVSKLTNNVAKDHVMEIFSTYGCIKSLELNSGKVTPGRPIYQIAFVEYDSPLDAGRAVKYMNGGMIDKHEITVEAVTNAKK